MLVSLDFQADCLGNGEEKSWTDEIVLFPQAYKLVKFTLYIELQRYIKSLALKGVNLAIEVHYCCG